MFRGINAINMDAKGRMNVPTRYRDAILKQVPDNSDYHLVVTIDTESPCLLLYPMNQWTLIEAKLEKLSSFNQASRRIQRLLLGHATELEMDTNGRILVPPLLRDYACLQKRVVLVGQGKKFEMWDEKCWSEHRQVWLAEQNKELEMPEELQLLSL